MTDAVNLPSCLAVGEGVSLAIISSGHHQQQGWCIAHGKKPYHSYTFQLLVLSFCAALASAFFFCSSAVMGGPLGPNFLSFFVVAFSIFLHLASSTQH